MGTNALSPLATLALVWLLPRKAARGPSNALERAMRSFFEHRLSGAAWAVAFEGEIERLVSRGLVARQGNALALADEGRRLALELLGLRRIPPKADFGTLYGKHLVPLAAARRHGVTLSPGELAKLGDANNLGAFATSRARGLKMKDAVPTRAQLRDALVWQALGLERQDEVSLPKLVQVLLSRLAGAEHARGAQQALDRLVTQALGARRTGAPEVRAAVVRAWVDCEAGPADASGAEGHAANAPPPRGADTRSRGATASARPDVADDGTTHGAGAGRPSSGPGVPLPLADFAARVVLEAQHAREGRFGERKVYISHLARRLAGSLSLDVSAFKSKLVEAHRAGLLTLSRADLVEVMSPDVVAASETSYLDATFHFVVADPVPAP